jgi:hypothetical protein
VSAIVVLPPIVPISAKTKIDITILAQLASQNLLLKILSIESSKRKYNRFYFFTGIQCVATLYSTIEEARRGAFRHSVAHQRVHLLSLQIQWIHILETQHLLEYCQF